MRNLMTALCLFGALAILVPAAALATGPSAGDQQYVDPLGGSHHGSTTTTTAPTTTTPAATPSSSTPTATTSSASTTTATGSSGSTGSKTLPFTGMNVWLAAGIGVFMLALGAGLRRSTRRRV